MNKQDFFYLVISKLRFPVLLLLIVFSISVLGLVLIEGTDTNGNPYQMSIFDALFVVVYTSTTVGFGEIPYPWNLNQKTWLMFVVISSVMSWLISVGRIVVILQDEHLKTQTRIFFFNRKMKKINENFYIIAGYGMVGEKLVDLMYSHGANLVIIDKNKDLIKNLKNCRNINIYAIAGDVSDLDYLKMLQINKSCCKALILATGSDKVNTRASLAAKILNPSLNIISRANRNDSIRNMKSFKTNFVLSPYQLFSEKIFNTIYMHEYGIIENVLTSESFKFKDTIIPSGRWVILGFNNFGKVLYKELVKKDYNFSIVDENIDKEKYQSDNFIQGNGVDGIDLKEAGVEESNVLIANNEDDFNNLSSVLTAKILNPSIYCISVLNDSKNKILFEEAGVDFIIEPFELMVRKIFSIVSEPLVYKLLKYLKNNDKDVIRLHNKLNYIKNKDTIVWNININSKQAPALYNHILSNENFKIGDMIKNNSSIIPLAIKNKKELTFLPNRDDFLSKNDTILLISTQKEKTNLEWIVGNNVFFSDLIKKNRD